MRNFILGSVSTMATSAGLTVANGGSVLQAQTTPELIGSVVAGVLSTVIINVLKARYPRLFASKKTKVIK